MRYYVKYTTDEIHDIMSSIFGPPKWKYKDIVTPSEVISEHYVNYKQGKLEEKFLNTTWEIKESNSYVILFPEHKPHMVFLKRSDPLLYWNFSFNDTVNSETFIELMPPKILTNLMFHLDLFTQCTTLKK